jgi:AraC-like DNA-binding protein
MSTVIISFLVKIQSFQQKWRPGLSANELIRKLRLQKAEQLLQQKWEPVSQVAYEVGFSNLSYFSKVFKDEFGVLPSEYV